MSDTLEQKARQTIDAMPAPSGWSVHDYKRYNPASCRSISPGEVTLKPGSCDWLLLADRKPAGVVEAKREGATLSGFAEQSTSYGSNLPEFFQCLGGLPFLFETTGANTFFRDQRDPDPHSQIVFSFHCSETLAEWLSESETLRARIQHLPPLPIQRMRGCYKILPLATQTRIVTKWSAAAA